MQDSDLWVENIINDSHDILYATGLRVLKRYGMDTDQLADDLQEVYILLWTKSTALQNHPNITGWLVDTLKKIVHSRLRKESMKAKQIRTMSLDDEMQAHQRKDAEAKNQRGQIEDKALTWDMEDTLREKLGEESASLLLRYYTRGSSQLASELNIPEGTLRVKIARLKQKLKNNFFHL